MTDFEQRIDISLAVRRYLRSAQHFQEAVTDVAAACLELRTAVPRNSRFVTQINYRHYLVTSDFCGNVDVEPIESW